MVAAGTIFSIFSDTSAILEIFQNSVTQILCFDLRAHFSAAGSAAGLSRTPRVRNYDRHNFRTRPGIRQHFLLHDQTSFAKPTREPSWCGGRTGSRCSRQEKSTADLPFKSENPAILGAQPPPGTDEHFEKVSCTLFPADKKKRVNKILKIPLEPDQILIAAFLKDLSRGVKIS